MRQQEPQTTIIIKIQENLHQAIKTNKKRNKTYMDTNPH